MKKASQILFLIGGIVAIFLTILWLVLAIVYFIYGGVAAIVAGTASGDVTQEMYQTVANWMKANGFNILVQSDWKAAAAQLAGTGVLFIIMSVFAIPAAVLCFVARKPSASLGLLITTLVFNILGGAPIGIVGAILGIVDKSVNGKKE